MAVDDSGQAPVVSKSHEPGSVFADESTNVIYTFTDAAGNTAQCVFTVNRVLGMYRLMFGVVCFCSGEECTSFSQ